MKVKKILVEILIVLVLCGLTLAKWTEPVHVTEVNTEYCEYSPFLSFDSLSLYFARGRTSNYYYFRIYEATREEPYGPFTSVREVLKSSGQHVFSPCISPDNLRMYYFAQTEYPILWQLKVSERTSVNDPWQQGINISELNHLGKIHKPALTADELIIVFASYDITGGQGGYDIWMAARPDMRSPFGEVTNLAEVNTALNDGDPFISPDGLTLYFQSNRNGPSQIFRTTRASLNETFGPVEHLTICDTPGGHSGHPCISSDCSTLYFIRQIGDDKSTGDIYVSYWIVDPYEDAINSIEDAIAEKLEALEKVNAAIEKEWTAYEALEELLDSGDYGDLTKADIIRAKQEIHSAIQHQELSKKTLERSIEKLQDALSALGWQPPQPVSYWTFDEGQGAIAYDSVGNNHGTVYSATWTTGQINGALSFDGVDNYVEVPDSPELNNEFFTMEAWIKTSATSFFGTFGTILVKGRVFNENCGLYVYNSGEVRLQFTSGGIWGDTTKYAFLDSSMAVNDGQFHHIVGTYNGEELKIYIDGSLNSSCAETRVPDKNNHSLRIGRRNNPEDEPWYSLVPFEGIIDEVAIYNRALIPEEIKQLYNHGSAGL